MKSGDEKGRERGYSLPIIPNEKPNKRPIVGNKKDPQPISEINIFLLKQNICLC